jgi:hypothetical protein
MHPQCVCPWCRRVQVATTNLWYERSEVLGSAQAEAGLLGLPDAICPDCSRAWFETLDSDALTWADEGPADDRGSGPPVTGPA